MYQFITEVITAQSMSDVLTRLLRSQKLLLLCLKTFAQLYSPHRGKSSDMVEMGFPQRCKIAQWKR